MVDLERIVEQAADRARPAVLDAEALIADSRRRRRVRGRLQVVGAAGAVAGLVVATSLTLGRSERSVALTPGSTSPTSSPHVPQRPNARWITPTPTGPLTPTFVNPTLHLPTTSPVLPRNLPPGWSKVCGKPGSSLKVQLLPVVVPRSLCDLRGVHIDVASAFGPATVPTENGIGVGISGSVATLKPGEVLDWSISTDKRTGDVTISGQR